MGSERSRTITESYINSAEGHRQVSHLLTWP